MEAGHNWSMDVKTTSKGIVFKVYVQPGASANQTAGFYNNALKIRLTAPPAEGKANRECLKFISGKLKIPKSDMEIISGAAGREKRILVRIPDADKSGRAAQDIKRKLESLSPQKGS